VIKQLVFVKKDNSKLRQSVEVKEIALKSALDENEKLKKNKSLLMGGERTIADDVQDKPHHPFNQGSMPSISGTAGATKDTAAGSLRGKQTICLSIFRYSTVCFQDRKRVM
jgi:hypothetical protein